MGNFEDQEVILKRIRREAHQEKFGLKFSRSIKFEPRDLWVGVYWNFDKDYREKVFCVYICIIPLFPIMLKFQKKIDR